MKRELKHAGFYHDTLQAADHCKAYPDEKGIETVVTCRQRYRQQHCKAYPDEKGIETNNISRYLCFNN